MSIRSNFQSLARPLRLHPAWTTWMWLGFAVATVLAIVVGFHLAGRPFWH